MTVLIRNPVFITISIFCVGLFLFTMGLSQQEIIGFESRFYLFALEMWRHGPSGFPTTYGAPYPDYPATTTLLIYGVAKLFGHLNKFTAVLPSAMAAAMTLSTTYLIGALFAPRWGMFAVLLMLLTNTFVMEARTISPDQYVALVTVLCFYLIYSAALLQRVRRLWFLPILLVLGFACRGPIGLVVPAGVVCVFYLFEKNFKAFFFWGLVAAVLLIVCGLLLLGLAYHVGGAAFVKNVCDMEVVGRLQDASLPWYFYFSESVGAYALTYPLMICIVSGVLLRWMQFQSKETKFILQLLLWVGVIMIGLTIPAGKKIRYILAIVPALSLICAALFVLPSKQRFPCFLQKISYGFCALLPLICFILVEIALRKIHFVSFAQLSNGFILLQCLVWLGRKSLLFVVSVAAVTFVMFYIGVVEPINLALNRSYDFVHRVEAARHKEAAKLVFYQENPDGTPIKYVVNMPHEEVPIFISTPTALAQFHGGAFFVSDPEHFAALPKEILARVKVRFVGGVGHDGLVVWVWDR